MKILRISLIITHCLYKVLIARVTYVCLDIEQQIYDIKERYDRKVTSADKNASYSVKIAKNLKN
jgi:hypothetical protein